VSFERLACGGFGLHHYVNTQIDKIILVLGLHFVNI